MHSAVRRGWRLGDSCSAGAEAGDAAPTRTAARTRGAVSRDRTWGAFVGLIKPGAGNSCAGPGGRSAEPGPLGWPGRGGSERVSGEPRGRQPRATHRRARTARAHSLRFPGARGALAARPLSLSLSSRRGEAVCVRVSACGADAQPSPFTPRVWLSRPSPRPGACAPLPPAEEKRGSSALRSSGPPAPGAHRARQSLRCREISRCLPAAHPASHTTAVFVPRATVSPARARGAAACAEGSAVGVVSHGAGRCALPPPQRGVSRGRAHGGRRCPVGAVVAAAASLPVARAWLCPAGSLAGALQRAMARRAGWGRGEQPQTRGAAPCRSQPSTNGDGDADVAAEVHKTVRREPVPLTPAISWPSPHKQHPPGGLYARGCVPSRFPATQKPLE